MRANKPRRSDKIETTSKVATKAEYYGQQLQLEKHVFPQTSKTIRLVMQKNKFVENKEKP